MSKAKLLLRFDFRAEIESINRIIETILLPMVQEGVLGEYMVVCGNIETITLFKAMKFWEGDPSMLAVVAVLDAEEDHDLLGYDFPDDIQITEVLPGEPDIILERKIRAAIEKVRTRGGAN